MRIEEYQEDYAIREFVLKKEERQIILEWNYREGTHFLIFLYDRGIEFSLSKARNWLMEKGISDEMIIKSQPNNPAYRAETGDVQVFCLRREEFHRARRSYAIAASGMGPCEVSLFACAYDRTEKELSVYQSQGQENVQAIPSEVRYHIQYKKGFLWIKKRCILQLPVMQGYQDGAIVYHVSGMAGNIDIPLSRACLGKNLYITMPDKDAELTVRIPEAYKKHYRLV
ncbi:MAG: hypothetical protein K2N34_12435 [Lachnospiraceae bacterium]|nr:hypothetical protein [Lachnospiraceae bacterium]